MSKRRAPTTPLHQPFPRTFRNRQASKQDVKPDPKCEFLSQRSLSHAGARGHSSSNACAREPTAAIQAINGGAVLPRITSHEQPGQL